MKLTCAALVIALGSQGCRDHADTLPVGNTVPSTPTSSPVAAPMPSAADIAAGEAMALAMAKAEAAKDGSIVVKGLPFIPPQAKWEARIRAGGNPIIVAMAGKLVVSPFFEPSPGIWEYIVTQEGGAFSLPIESDTLPIASEVQTNLPGGQQVTTPTVHATLGATGEISDVGVTPWALPEPGHTVDMDLDICMAAEIGATGLTLDRAVHAPIGGAPGLLAAASGKIAGIPYQALLWKIYLPDSKLLLSYSVYSATPSDLRTAGEMMLKMFTVGPQP